MTIRSALAALRLMPSVLLLACIIGGAAARRRPVPRTCPGLRTACLLDWTCCFRSDCMPDPTAMSLQADCSSFGWKHCPSSCMLDYRDQQLFCRPRGCEELHRSPRNCWERSNCKYVCGRCVNRAAVTSCETEDGDRCLLDEVSRRYRSWQTVLSDDDQSVCDLLEEDPDVAAGLGACLAVVHQLLCSSTIVKPPWRPSVSPILKYTAKKPPLKGIDGIYLINLRRRADRLDRFFATGSLRREHVQLIEAYDGLQLWWSYPLQRLFRNYMFLPSLRPGVAGCALSHLKLWLHIAMQPDNQKHLILEDDAVLPEDFADRWNGDYAAGLPVDTTLAYIGGVTDMNKNLLRLSKVFRPVTSAFAAIRENEFFAHNFETHIDRGDAKTPRLFHFRTSSYVLSPAGARELLSLVRAIGLRLPCDHVLMKLETRQHDRVFVATPLLVGHPSSNRSKTHGEDSDVQWQTVSLANVTRPPTDIDPDLEFLTYL